VGIKPRITGDYYNSPGSWFEPEREVLAINILMRWTLLTSLYLTSCVLMYRLFYYKV
jgi:hypothetical protein